MVKAEVRHQAFALFLKGYSLRKISTELQVSRSTVERWSIQDQYVSNRRHNHERVLDEIRATEFESKVKQQLTMGDAKYDSFQEAYAEQKAIRHASDVDFTAHTFISAGPKGSLGVGFWRP